MKFVFQCKNCGKENDITGVIGSCGNCDNNKLQNFEIIITNGELRGMGRVQALGAAKGIRIGFEYRGNCTDRFQSGL